MVDDFKNIFTQKNNQHLQIIVLAVVLFLVKLLIIAIFPNIASYFYFSHSFISKPWTIFTFPISSSSIFSLLFTSLMFYWVGLILTDFIGGSKMLQSFLWTSFGALVCFLVFELSKAYFQKLTPNFIFSNGLEIGLIGVLFSCITLLPQYEVMIIRFPVKLKYIAFVLLILNLAGNPKFWVLYSSAAIIGYLYIKFIQTDFARVKKQETPAISSKPAKSRSYYPNQDEVDVILDKISKVGFEGLSKDEQERLKRASEKQD